MRAGVPGKSEIYSRGGGKLRINSFTFLDLFKKIRSRSCGFRSAEQQKSCRLQSVVETVEIIDLLHTIGVDYAQGYGIARPMAFERMLEGDAAARAVGSE